MRLRAILNTSTDPYFNLASEEYLLDTADSDVFMLWRNSPSVIIGKNQNTWAEVDKRYAEENGISVVRRLTGGGAVFHDLGNVNFSFITAAAEKTLDFRKFTAPIISALEKAGIDAALDGRNDIVADGYKISGNAECVRNNRKGEPMMLHHGTLLFGADLSRLASVLTVAPEKIKSKGIKSVASRVRNISSFPSYAGPSDVEGFIELIMDSVSASEATSFSDKEAKAIEKLKNDKYYTWNWNWGASPVFGLERTARFPFGTLTAMVACRDGRIEKIKLCGDFFGTEDVSSLEGLLVGAKFEAESICAVLENAGGLTERCISGAAPCDLAGLITGA